MDETEYGPYGQTLSALPQWKIQLWQISFYFCCRKEMFWGAQTTLKAGNSRLISALHMAAREMWEEKQQEPQTEDSGAPLWHPTRGSGQLTKFILPLLYPSGGHPFTAQTKWVQVVHNDVALKYTIYQKQKLSNTLSTWYWELKILCKTLSQYWSHSNFSFKRICGLNCDA